MHTWLSASAFMAALLFCASVVVGGCSTLKALGECKHIKECAHKGVFG